MKTFCMRLFVAAILSGLMLAGISTSTFAQSPQITSGLSWLSANQSQDGSWQSSSMAALQSTAEILNTLSLIGNKDASYDNAMSWLNSQTVVDTEFLARRILLSGSSYAASDLSAMLSYQYLSGSWGGYSGYSNDILDTTLALLALKSANYTDTAVINAAVNCLINNQNSDGGFGFSAGDSSNTYMTALVLDALSQFKTTYNLQTPINNAVAYLLTKQNSDGGFGSSPSNVYETALSFISLIESGQGSALPLQNAINYITSNQLPDGSWNDDPYSTALALRALSNVKPNLAIMASDIAFSNPAPTVGNTITITANIKNTGPTKADNVLVRFYDGNTLIGEMSIPAIPAYGNVQAAIDWKVLTAATHTITVSIDALNQIDELSNADNSATSNITSATLADLSISSADIAISPSAPAPGDTLTITATARNKGETAESNVTVDLYDGNPAAGGALIGRSIVSSIQPGGDSSVQVSGKFTEGLHTIYAVLDKDNSVVETDETNNTAAKTINVTSAMDLLVSASDISFTPLYPKVGETVTVSARINNIGPGTARNVAVRFYLGEPASGGAQIGSEMILPEIPAGGSVSVSVLFNTAGYAGNRNIYVSVDPQNKVPELSEANNKAYGTLKVAVNQGPDFTIAASDITISPQSPLQGDIATVSAIIRNSGIQSGGNIEVRFSIYEPAADASLVIGSRTVKSLAAGSSETVQVIWFAPDPGEYLITAEIDPKNDISEMDETNNTAGTTATVTAPQGPDITATTIDRSGAVVNKQTRVISGNISVTLKNMGTTDILLPFTITAFEDRNNNQTFDPSTDGILGQLTYSGNLGAGASDTVTIAINGTTLYQDSPVYLATDSGNAITELKETNNTDCLPFLNACRYSDVDNAMRSGSSWLIDHQRNIDTQGTMKAWGSSSIIYNAYAVQAYYSSGKTSGTKYNEVLNKLIEMQAPDGSWDEAISTTAEGIISLLYVGTPAGNPYIKNAVSWIIRQQNTDGGWGYSKGAQSNAIATGRALTALMKAGVSKNENYVQRAVQWLKNTQNGDGYWGAYPGEVSNTHVDTYPVIGLALATSFTDDNVAAAKSWHYARRYSYELTEIYWLKMILEIDPNNSDKINVANALLNSQRTDGGWTDFTPYKTYSFFDLTATAVNVLSRLGIRGTNINNGIQWIENHVNSQGVGFPEEKDVSLTDYVLDALQAAKIADSANLQAIAAGRKTIVYTQNIYGGWFGPIPVPTLVAYGNTYTGATGESLFALKYYQDLSASEQAAASMASNFLLGSQRYDGSWGRAPETGVAEFGSTEIALVSLLQSGLTAGNSTVFKGLTYLNSQQASSGGFGTSLYTARAAMIYKLAGANYQSRLSQTVSWLKANQNPDGGWGTSLGFTSTTSSTSWALIGLAYGGETGIEVAKGVSWLLAAQNQDNGWGQVMGVPMSYDNSTALAVWALSISRFVRGFNLDLTLDKTSYCPSDIVRITTMPDKPVQDISMTGSVTLQEGVSYAMNFINTETSFVSEFTVPSGALPGTSTVNVTGTATYGYGTATKSFIVKSCSTLLPDLSVSNGDVSSTVADTRDPDARVITAVIRNQGDGDAGNIAVNFYKGAPSPENLVETQTIPNIGSHGSAAVNGSITIAEDTPIYIVVDPYNSISELDENNNTAVIALTRTVPDLSISSSDVSIVPPVIEGQSAKITAIIHNIGNSGASDVTVSFYDGGPASGGTLIGSVTKAYIASGATSFAEVQWNTFGQSGRNYIHVVIDLENTIRESNENNNATLLAVDVAPPTKPDLAVTSSDIAFSNLNPKEGDPLRITATIHNLGTQTGNIVAALYDGDPSSGGILLASRTIDQLVHFGGSLAVDFDVDTIGVNGDHRFYVVTDPENNIDEINETNNIAWDELTIGPSGVSLTVSTDKPVYTADEDVAITATLFNQKAADRSGTVEVKIIDTVGNVASAVGSQLLSLGPNQTGIMNFTWKTGAMLHGDYTVYVHFIEAGNAAAKTTAPFMISAVRDISSKISTDKMKYEVNQPVTINSAIVSLSPNYIFEDLTATVTVNAVSGRESAVFIETKKIVTFMPGAAYNFKSYWKTGTASPDVYNATLEVFSGIALLSSSSATFEILRTSSAGVGLSGTIAAAPTQVYQGREEAFNWGITNNGNEDIFGLTAKIIIADPDTQEAKAEVGGQWSVLRGGTVTETQTVSTVNLAPKTYLAILQAEIGGNVKTLASATFEVLPTIEIKQTIPDYGRVLVWINDGCYATTPAPPYQGWEQEKCVRKDLAEKALKEIGVTYNIVTDKKDFQAELRNNYYTDFMILGNFNPLGDHYGEELREKIFLGKGLITSPWIGESEGDMLGIKAQGKLSQRDNIVELSEGDIFRNQLYQSFGEAVKIDASPDNVLGWITTNKGSSKYPAVVKKDYGNGKTIYFSFDLGLSVKEENYAQFVEVLRSAVNYTHTPENAPAYYPYDLVPVRLELKSLGAEFDMKALVRYPGDIKIFDPLTSAWVTENSWEKEVHLDTSETKNINLLVLTPDAVGAYALTTDISYLEDGIYKPYQTLSTEIKIEKDAYILTTDILYKLSTLYPTLSGEMDKLNEAKTYLESVRNRPITGSADTNSNVHDILKAIEAILKITSADFKEIRLDLDTLLAIYGEMGYLNP